MLSIWLSVTLAYSYPLMDNLFSNWLSGTLALLLIPICKGTICSQIGCLGLFCFVFPSVNEPICFILGN